MVVILLILLGVSLGIDVLVLLRRPLQAPPSGTITDLPDVTLLIAVRNEEKNLEELVENLLSLDYPDHKMQILIGEDRSQDGTKALLDRLTASHENVTVIDIQKDIKNLKAKANVLAQLINYARNEYLFILDADVRVPPSWVRTMLQHTDPGLGVIGGCTVVMGGNTWSQLQNMEWLLAQYQLLTAAGIYGTLAVSGTNMMITSSACQAIGGYEKIPHSLTEDIGFLQEATAHGFQAKYISDLGALAHVKPQPSWGLLFSQRRRWIYGALKLPLPIVLLLALRALFLVVLIILAFWEPWWALGLFLVRGALQTMVVARSARMLGQILRPAAFIIFEFYHTLLTLGSLLLYTLPYRFSWKGRTYQ